MVGCFAETSHFGRAALPRGSGGDTGSPGNFNSVNVCRKIPPTDQIFNSPEKKKEVEVREDLNDAPRRGSFYGRTEELATLETAILEA